MRRLEVVFLWKVVKQLLLVALVAALMFARARRRMVVPVESCRYLLAREEVWATVATCTLALAQLLMALLAT
jgi:hypothetical protein